MRSNTECANEIKKLEAAKSFVPHFTRFNDDNHKRIDAQIYTIKNRLTEEQVAERYLPGEDDIDGEASDEEMDIEANARDAAYWLTEDRAAPSLDWYVSFEKKAKKKGK